MGALEGLSGHCIKIKVPSSGVEFLMGEDLQVGRAITRTGKKARHTPFCLFCANAFVTVTHRPSTLTTNFGEPIGEPGAWIIKCPCGEEVEVPEVDCPRGDERQLARWLYQHMYEIRGAHYATQTPQAKAAKAKRQLDEITAIAEDLAE